MRTSVAALTALSGLALALTSVARANPVADPVYTFCETEDNDLCSIAQILDANLAAASVGGGAEGEFVRDCFYLTGKLQEDCVWDVEPKCAMKVYDKPLPCRTTSGAVIPGNFYEPVLRSSSGEDLTHVVPLSDHTVRLGVAALQDAFDGTINGLANNGPHGEVGEVTIKVFYNGGGDGQPRGDQPDQSYVFKFGGEHEPVMLPVALPRGVPMQIAPCEPAIGSDAVRVAFIIPANVSSVDIVCCNNTGQQPLCYDVDNYKVTNLIPGRFYAIEVIGGLDDREVRGECADCGVPTNTKLGWFDKNCNLVAFDDNIFELSELINLIPPCLAAVPMNIAAHSYSKMFATTEADGSLRFAVSGGGFDLPLVLDREVDNGSIPSQGSGGDTSPDNMRIVSLTIPGDVDSFLSLDRIAFVQLGELTHTWVGDLTIRLRHVDSGRVVTLVDRPGYPTPAGQFGFSSDLNGEYTFADNPVLGQSPQNFEAAASHNPIAPGVYHPEHPLSAFAGDTIGGTWSLEITDITGGDTGNIGEWTLALIVSNHGDCDFNGLNDKVQDQYFDLLDRLRIIDGLNYAYRQGASTKDESIDDVNRYPRFIWDPQSNQNLHGEDFFRAFGGAPEAFAQHGICGGYCIKIQLAEHVDPSERPTGGGVMSSARADINSDGVVNASDLALLLSYWGVVN